MRVELYDNKYKEELACLLVDYFKESHSRDYDGSLDKALTMIDILLHANMFIYLVIDKDRVVGFTSLVMFNQYGMTKDHLIVDHMYVIPEYRSGKAILWLYTTVANVMDYYKCDGLGTTLAWSSNVNNNKLIGGEVIAYVTRVKNEDMQDKFGRYKKYLKIKD